MMSVTTVMALITVMSMDLIHDVLEGLDTSMSVMSDDHDGRDECDIIIGGRSLVKTFTS